MGGWFPVSAMRLRTCFRVMASMAKSKGFRVPPAAAGLAVAVADALEIAEPLVAEAGTGVGKSLAYLVPAARFALETGRKAVISTHTINLQEQLVSKDIPDCQEVAGGGVARCIAEGAEQLSMSPAVAAGAWSRPGICSRQSENDELEAIRKWAEAPATAR
jgi:ATP-dependent DNA helicase DinG